MARCNSSLVSSRHTPIPVLAEITPLTMSSFTALMALSASKTQEQNNLVERVKEERRKKELLLQKQRAEQEAKEREMEKRRRIKHFEEEKREEERRKRKEEIEKAREAAMQRKKDEQRDVLLYGAKKVASSRASSSSVAGNGGSKERRKGPDVNDDDSPSGPVLTREELRERRQQAEMKRLYSSTRRSATGHSYSKAGRRLPGGAMDITTTPQSPDTLSGKGVRDRIAALPNTLTKLNTVKRDTRTIDEITADLKKKKEGKVLDGDDAKQFDGWFSTKKKEPIKKAHASSSVGSDSNSPTSSAPPPSNPSPPAKKSAVTPSSTARIPKISTAKPSLPRPTSQPSLKPANGSRAGSLDKYPSNKGIYPQSAKGSKPHPGDRENRNFSRPNMAPASMKKRPRSESRSESPPPKRRAPAGDGEDLPGDISSTIWSIFGRKRDSYVGMDVFSDDEDMEADADALEREELRSARIAKKEDLEAFEAERRHEEEKRKRKKEKDRSSRY